MPIYGISPAGRSQHTAVVYQKVMYIFGGAGAQSAVFGDFYAFNFGLFYFNDFFFYFFSFFFLSFFFFFFFTDTHTWRIVQVPNPSIAFNVYFIIFIIFFVFRFYIVVVYGNRMYVFGGEYNQKSLNDLFYFDFSLIFIFIFFFF
jgi:hypothetical protein